MTLHTEQRLLLHPPQTGLLTMLGNRALTRWSCKLLPLRNTTIGTFSKTCRCSASGVSNSPSVRPYHYISCSFYRILSISHTGHHYNVAGVMEETSFFFRVIFGPFSAIFRLKNVPLYLLQFLSDSFNIAHRASLQCRGRHGRNFFFRVIFGPLKKA